VQQSNQSRKKGAEQQIVRRVQKIKKDTIRCLLVPKKNTTTTVKYEEFRALKGTEEHQHSNKRDRDRDRGELRRTACNKALLQNQTHTPHKTETQNEERRQKRTVFIHPIDEEKKSVTSYTSSYLFTYRMFL
jgi:hypothetical protein